MIDTYTYTYVFSLVAKEVGLGSLLCWDHFTGFVVEELL